MQQANVRIEDHDACGVGFVASMTGKQKREVVGYLAQLPVRYGEGKKSWCLQ